MRKDIRTLCVTNWGAVLEVKGWYKCNFPYRLYPDSMTLRVADPDCIDAGIIIGINDIKLIARKKP